MGEKWEEFCALLASWIVYQGVAGDATGWQAFSQGVMLLPNIPVSAGVMSRRIGDGVKPPLVDLEASHCELYILQSTYC